MRTIEQIYNQVDWHMRRRYHRPLEIMTPVPDAPGYWDLTGEKKSQQTQGGCGGCSPQKPGRFLYTDPTGGDPFYSWRRLSAAFEERTLSASS